MLKVHVKYHLKPGTQADFLAGVTEKTLQDAVLNEPDMARIAELKDQYMDHMDLDMEEV